MMKINWEVEIININTTLNVRSGPSTTHNVVGSFKNGDQTTVVESSGDWLKLKNGSWISSKYTKTIKDLDKANESNEAPIMEDVVQNDVEELIEPDLDDIFRITAYSGSQGNLRENKFINRIMGLPPQFIDITDFRNGQSSGFGRLYAETILSDNTILLMSPGRPDFMTGLSKKAKKNAEKGLANSYNSDDAANLESLIGGEHGRYYSFAYQFSYYMQYVNTLCRSAAHKLGIGGLPSPFKKIPYGTLDWTSEIEDSQTAQKYMSLLMGHTRMIPFYVDYPGTSVSQSISNSTDKSKLDGLINAGSDLVREAEFLLGVSGASSIIALNSESYMETVTSAVQKYTDGKDSGRGFFGRLGEMATTIFKGGQLVFPEIYRDSQYSKNQSVSMKLKSPYGDKESIYLNVLVPLYFILAMALPRQLSPNATISPFLVRAMSPGWFSCDMAIIESMTWDVPSDANWSVDGLPLEMNINFSIRDMYSSLAASPNKEIMSKINVGMLDFITTTCGANMNVPDMDKIMLEITQDWQNFFADSGREVVGNFQEWVINHDAFKSISNMLNKVR